MDHEKNNMKCLQGTTWKDQRRESVQFKVKLVRKHLYRRSAGPESFSDGQFQPSEAQWWREQRKKYDYYYREAIETSPAEVSNVHERFYVDRPTNWIIRSKKKPSLYDDEHTTHSGDLVVDHRWTRKDRGEDTLEVCCVFRFVFNSLFSHLVFRSVIIDWWYYKRLPAGYIWVPCGDP